MVCSLSSCSQIIFRRWKISLRNEGKGASPTEITSNYEDFEYDEGMHSKYSHYI